MKADGGREGAVAEAAGVLEELKGRVRLRLGLGLRRSAAGGQLELRAGDALGNK